MATSTVYSGRLAVDLLLQAVLSGDKAGVEKTPDDLGLSVRFGAAGGDAPTLSGFLHGEGSISGATTLLLAHASDPFQGAGDASYSEGFTVAGSKLKVLALINTGSVNLTVARAASNGLPILDANGDALTLDPGGMLLLYRPAGTVALATGTSDGLTITPASGTGNFQLAAGYGP
jgi:hypothetical protein